MGNLLLMVVVGLAVGIFVISLGGGSGAIYLGGPDRHFSTVARCRGGHVDRYVAASIDNGLLVLLPARADKF